MKAIKMYLWFICQTDITIPNVPHFLQVNQINESETEDDGAEEFNEDAPLFSSTEGISKSPLSWDAKMHSLPQNASQ